MPSWVFKPVFQNVSKTILTFLLLLCFSLSNAQTFTRGGLTYVVTAETNVLIIGGCFSGALIIPSTIINEGI